MENVFQVKTFFHFFSKKSYKGIQMRKKLFGKSIVSANFVQIFAILYHEIGKEHFL